MDLRRYVSRAYARLVLCISITAIVMMTIAVVSSAGTLPVILLVAIAFALPVNVIIAIVYSYTLFLFWKKGDV